MGRLLEAIKEQNKALTEILKKESKWSYDLCNYRFDPKPTNMPGAWRGKKWVNY